MSSVDSIGKNESGTATSGEKIGHSVSNDLDPEDFNPEPNSDQDSYKWTGNPREKDGDAPAL